MAGGEGHGFVDAAGGGPGGLSRRTFLNRAGLVAGLAALGQLPAFLDERGLLDAARAADPDLTRDTINGLVAFVVPGDDEYSVAQGESTPEPGGIDAGTTDLVIELLDRFVGTAEGPTLPSSGGVATLLNSTALSVNPAASGGAFASPFARLAFAEKIEVFRQLESTTEGSELRFVSGILIGAVAFLAFSEGGAFDATTRQVTATPVGWRITGYDGVAEGRKELKGYYQGRRKVRTSARYRVRR